MAQDMRDKGDTHGIERIQRILEEVEGVGSAKELWAKQVKQAAGNAAKEKSAADLLKQGAAPLEAQAKRATSSGQAKTANTKKPITSRGQAKKKKA